MPPKTYRDRIRSLRLTAGEDAMIRAKAHVTGLTFSAYLRRVGLGKRVRARPGQVDDDALYHLARIGNNLNQIARAMNTARKGARQPVAQERLEEVLEKLHVLLDRLCG